MNAKNIVDALKEGASDKMKTAFEGAISSRVVERLNELRYEIGRKFVTSKTK